MKNYLNYNKGDVLISPAIILAGGESKRMGQDKFNIDINGKPMIIHVIENLKSAGCNEILIQTKQNKTELENVLSNYDVKWNYDLSDDNDVLKALLSALNYAKNENWNSVQLMPVDTPFVSQKLIRKLSYLLEENLEVVIPSSNSSKNTPSNGLEPLLSCLKVNPTIKKINENINKKDRRLGKILSEMKCLIVDEKIWSKWDVFEKSFKNINYPNDRE
ncbi:MAG: hypothetical protein CMA03_04045 [Euryarchaeota archaeon]|nr:hypothetical protein [Euryarchaeota archaeon]